MGKIKIGIIGTGRMGITHYSIINSHPDVTVSEVADPSGLVLTLMGKYLPVKTYKDYNELFNESSPDAVLVCTPPNLHYPIIKGASEKGIHVFVEKPFTTKLSEGAELALIYSGNRLVNQVGYVNRFNDIFCKVKEFIDNGAIGKVIRFKSEMFSCTISNSNESSGWRSTRESGGGAVFEMASHAIDMVNFLVGKPDKVTGSSLNHVYSKKVEDAVSATFLYNNGMSGTIYINWSDTSYRKPTNKIEIFGEDGKILADQHCLKIFLNKPYEKFKLRKGWNTLYITDVFKPVPFYVRGNEFTSQLWHFVDCIQGKEKTNRCTFADGADTLEVIENIFNDYELNGENLIMKPIDKIIFGDNQFFGINHMSQEKAQQLAEQFFNIDNIYKVYHLAYDLGVRAFMLNSHARAYDICKYFKENESHFEGVFWYPSIPYAYKYANLVAEKGIMPAINEVLFNDNTAGGVLGMIAKGGVAVLTKDAFKLMQMLIDVELRAFKGMNIRVAFLQNIITDLMLGYGVKEIFYEFCEHIRKRYNALPGLVTQNMPYLKSKLEEWGISEVVICSSFNKIGYLMSPDRDSYINTANNNDSTKYQLIAMSTLASGAIPVNEAYDFINKQKIQSVVFGASSKRHIEETLKLIDI